MPIYEYACKNCHDDFELLVRANERPQCPNCGSPKLEKQLSVPAAHSNSVKSLPVCQPTHGGCGRPQCGTGACAFE